MEDEWYIDKGQFGYVKRVDRERDTEEENKWVRLHLVHSVPVNM